MTAIRFALLSLMLFALPGCRARPLIQHASDGQKSYDEFRATINSFPYSTSPERRDLVVNNYPSLRVGMTKQQVAALIGNPDYK